ncbi:MAG: PEGA domain-containing protein [Vicinamibacterales bacterium]
MKIDSSTPHGADVVIDGTTVGKTPYEGTLPKADRDVKVVLKLSGHRDRQLSVRADSAITQTLKLEPRARATTTTKTNRDQSVNPFGN